VVHLLLYGLLAIIVAAALFLLASRFLPAGEQIAPALRDEPPWELPVERALTGDDVDGVRLPVALRGYRFAEVDILLERLALELRRRDTEIATLRGDAPAAVDEPVPPEAYAAPERFAPPAVTVSKADDATGDDDG
jgi:DivIVA domain-containing protein